MIITRRPATASRPLIQMVVVVMVLVRSMGRMSVNA
jgi:hypothetical protein